MYIDSHCHINFPEFTSRLPEVFGAMAANQVSHALCVGVNFEELDSVLELAASHPNVFASVGVHPDHEQDEEPTVERLCDLARRPKVVAIGETGLDYYRLKGNLEWQRERFRTHIRAARQTGLPLIVHTRSAQDDTAAILNEEMGKGAFTGVLHCFTGSLDLARKAMDIGFYVSMSGIVTFKNAKELQETAKAIPANRLLIETDAPFLAPVPNRGKPCEPAFVADTARFLAELRGEPIEQLAATTSANFHALFTKAG